MTATTDPHPSGAGRTLAPARAVRRVLVVANAYPDEVRPHYGAYVHTAVRGLREAGLDVDVLAVRGYAGKQEYLRGGGRLLALNAARGAYDVVHAYYGLMGVAARLQLRSPLVITFTGGDIQGEHHDDGRPVRSSQVKAQAYLQTARLSAATITRTPAMAELLPPPVRRRNRVIPAGVDLDRYARLSRDEARARLGWDPEEPTVIFVADPGRHVKNFPLAEAAVERLRRDRPQARLRVAADVEPGEVPVWMAAADALILSSRSEGSPNVVKEAMAAELPVVATAVGDVPDRLAGLPGCAVCGHDADELAAGLARALGHGRVPEARTAMAELSLERVTERVIDVYEDALRRRHR